jgi:hypothetical protein
MRDNQINFLFSRQFHIGFIRINQAGYNSFFNPQSKKVLIKPTIFLSEHNIDFFMGFQIPR